MGTDELIARLSAASGHLRRAGPVRMVVLASGLSVVVVSVIAAVWLGFDWSNSTALVGHAALLRITFLASLAASALSVVRDLSTPGRRVVRPLLTIAPSFAIMAMLVVHDRSGGVRDASILEADHYSWLACLWQSAALALPAFVIMFAAVRHLAPTDLKRAGGYIGLLAGAIGAIGHCLHRVGDLAADISAYTIGIGLVVGLGMLLGPRVLRWT